MFFTILLFIILFLFHFTLYACEIVISSQTVQTAMEKKKNKNLSNIIANDLRGCHNNQTNRYPKEMLNEVRNHIKQFPVFESHYCRENTQRNYLEGLSISKMNQMYVLQKTEEIKKTDINDEENDEESNEENDEDENEYEEQENQKQIINRVELEEGKVTKKGRSSIDVTDCNFVRLSRYTEIFNKEFNLGFFKPKKDQ